MFFHGRNMAKRLLLKASEARNPPEGGVIKVCMCCSAVYFLYIIYIFLIEIHLLYNIMLVSGVLHSIWHWHPLWNDHHGKSSNHLSPYSKSPAYEPSSCKLSKMWMYYKPITVQYYIADCVSWVPRLTLLDLRTNWSYKCALRTELVCM